MSVVHDVKCHIKYYKININCFSSPAECGRTLRPGYYSCTMLSFVEGMSEFMEGEVSLVCRKIILIHGQNPGFYYLQDKRFK